MLLHPVRGRSDFAPWNMMRLMPNTLWIGVLLLAWLVSRTTPTYIAAANLVALGSLIIPFGALVVRRVPGPFTPDREKLPEMLRYGLPCMVTSVPQMLNLRLDQLVMVAVIPPRDLGLYVVAVAWSSAVSPILNSVGAVAMPAVASSADHRFAAQRLCRAVRMATALAALMSLVVTAAAPVAIELFFGAAFRGSLSSALVLIPAAGVLGINYTLQEGIRGLGFPYEVLRAELIGLAMTGIGLAVMLPTFGILGAAIASLVGYSSVGASLAATACRRTGAGPTELLVPKLAEIRDAIAHVGALARSALAPA
jgi:O-antigen/teichoic acid export membrane protein